MIFFRRSGPLIRARTPREMLFRSLGLVLVLSIVIWLFWKNSELAMHAIESRGAINDQTQTLTKTQRKDLQEFAKIFEDEFGMELKIKIVDRDLDPPAPDSKTLFLGLETQSELVVIQAPPLVEKALGREFFQRLEREHFVPFFENNQWPRGLYKALAEIWDALLNVNDPNRNSPETNGDAHDG